MKPLSSMTHLNICDIMKNKKKYYPVIKEFVDNDKNLSELKNQLMDFADLLKSKIKEIEIENNINKKSQPISKNKRKALRKKNKK